MSSGPEWLKKYNSETMKEPKNKITVKSIKNQQGENPNKIRKEQNENFKISQSQIYESGEFDIDSIQKDQCQVYPVPESYKKSIIQITKSLTTHFGDILKHTMAEYKKLKQRHTQTTQKLSECQAQNMFLSELINDKAQQIQAQIGAHKALLIKFQDEVKRSKQQKVRLQSDQLISSLKIKSLQQDIKEKEACLSKAYGSIEEIQSQISRLKHEQIDQRQKNIQQQINYRKTAQNNFNQEKQKMKQEFKVTQERLQSQIDKQQKIIKQLRTINTNSQGTIQILKQQKKQMLNKINQLSNQVNASNLKNIAQGEKCQRFQNSLKKINERVKGLNVNLKNQNSQIENIIVQYVNQLGDNDKYTVSYFQVSQIASCFASFKCRLLINQIFQGCMSAVNPSRKNKLKADNLNNLQAIISQVQGSNLKSIWTHFQKILDRILDVQLQQKPVRFVQASEKINFAIDELRNRLLVECSNKENLEKTGETLVSLRTQNERLIKAGKKLSLQVQECQYQINKLNKQIETLKQKYEAQIQDLKNQYYALQNSMSSTQSAQVQDLRAKLTRTQKNLEAFKQSLKEKNQTIRIKSDKVNSLEEQIKRIKNQLKQKDQQIFNLQNQNEQIQAKALLHNSTSSQIQNRLKQEIKKNQNLQIQIRQLEEALSIVQIQRESLRQQFQVKLKEQQRSMKANFQKIFSPHFKNIDFKADSLNDMEQKISKQLNSNKKNAELITSQILSQRPQQKAFVIEAVNSFVQKQIVSSEFVYKWNKNINTDFTAILKDLKNFILVFKLQQKDYKFGFFVEKIGLSQSTAKQKAFLFSITDKKAFYLSNNIVDVKTVFFSLGTSLIYFGNKQIRVTNKSNQIKSSYGGIGKKYFDVRERHELFGNSKDEFNFSEMEIHAFKFR